MLLAFALDEVRVAHYKVRVELIDTQKSCKGIESVINHQYNLISDQSSEHEHTFPLLPRTVNRRAYMPYLFTMSTRGKNLTNLTEFEITCTCAKQSVSPINSLFQIKVNMLVMYSVISYVQIRTRPVRYSPKSSTSVLAAEKQASALGFSSM